MEILFMMSFYFLLNLIQSSIARVTNQFKDMAHVDVESI